MARPRGHKIDAVDIRIIAALQTQPDLGYAELGKLVNLKYTPCRRRVKQLLDNGYIVRSVSVRASKFSRKNGYLILVELRDTSYEAVNLFSSKILEMNEVDTCLELDGVWDFAIRLYLENHSNYAFIQRDINDMTLNGAKIVLRTHTFPVARMVKGAFPVESLRFASDVETESPV